MIGVLREEREISLRHRDTEEKAKSRWKQRLDLHSYSQGGLRAASNSRGRHGIDSPQFPERTNPANTLNPDFWHPELRENKSLLF